MQQNEACISSERRAPAQMCNCWSVAADFGLLVQTEEGLNVGQSISILGCQACMAEDDTDSRLAMIFCPVPQSCYLILMLMLAGKSISRPGMHGRGWYGYIAGLPWYFVLFLDPVPRSCSLILIFLFWSLMLGGRALVFWEERHSIAGGLIWLAGLVLFVDPVGQSISILI